MPLPKELERADQQSRYRWSVAAGEVLVQALDRVTLLSIVAAGEDEFIRQARRQMHNQGFKQEDFQRMYQRLRVAAGAVGAAGRV